MKNLITIIALFLGTFFGFSQEILPTAEQVLPNTLKTTFYHSNGNIMHQGDYVDGKTDGLWKSYDEAGNLISEGSFVQGKKTGLWNFYTQKTLNAVVYIENKISDVKKFDTNALAEN